MLAVAILPSNQVANHSTVPTFEAYNEHEKMHWLASTIAADCQVRGLRAEAFPVKAENEPGQTYPHQWIVDAVERANGWLKTRGGGVMIHLHTDSGAASHTFGIYAGQRWPQSQALADALGRRAHELLATESYRAFDRLGDIDYNTYVFAARAAYTPCLLELFSHQSARDVRTFYAHADRLAAALADALLAYLSVGGTEDEPAALAAPVAAEYERLRPALVRLWTRAQVLRQLACQIEGDVIELKRAAGFKD